MNSGEHGVIVRVVCDEFFDDGYESFNDAIEEMLSKWGQLNAHERASIKRRGYRNALGADYMTAVAFYDEETGEAWESMSLAEAMEAMEEEEEEGKI